MKFFILLLTTFLLVSCNFRGKRKLVGESEYQQTLNAQFKDASKSPLKKKDLKTFKGLDFFPIDSTYITIAKLTKTPDAPVFEMATTTDRKPLYKSYAIAKFILQNKEHRLIIFQNIEDVNDEVYRDYLFLPFTDLTSGETSYGGGRYMDVFISSITANNTVVLNFNNTYNPYCAYNSLYSCPITPRENHLDIPVKAGIKAFKK